MASAVNTRYFLLLILALPLCILAQSANAQDKPQVVATTTFIADIAQNIGGNSIRVESLLPVGSDPHLYEPVPGDARKIANAEVVLMNGLTLEGWLQELIDNSGTKADVVVISRGVETITDPAHHNATDPHAWMSAANGIIYAQNIAQALTSRYPEHTATIQQNFERYKKELEAAASLTFKKDKRINIRISNRDLAAIQSRATEEGIPYQTYVSSILHKYISGSLQDLTANKSSKRPQ